MPMGVAFTGTTRAGQAGSADRDVSLGFAFEPAYGA